MIVVCIKEIKGLTVDKQYEVLSSHVNYDWDLVADDYFIINDYGIDSYVTQSYFISLQDWRDKQIEKLINE